MLLPATISFATSQPFKSDLYSIMSNVGPLKEFNLQPDPAQLQLVSITFARYKIPGLLMLIKDISPEFCLSRNAVEPVRCF